jgi:hypothetical protein
LRPERILGEIVGKAVSVVELERRLAGQRIAFVCEAGPLLQLVLGI